jgi:glyoxylase-like metal-dependent hydrolase (beta-lactamase superfamily II)
MSHGLRVADRWFERKTFDDGITWLTESHVHPLLRCNIWHVRGRDRDLLVDTGLGVASLREELQDLIDKPLVAVATHVHYDHVGSLHEFDDARMHRLESANMADYREFQWLRRDEFPGEWIEALAETGMTFEGEYLLDAAPSPDFDPASYRVRSTPTTSLDEGDGIDLGDRRFEVLHLPGHSPGSLGLWDATGETLFSGDAIYDGLLLDDLPESDISAYVNTMKRLRTLPVRVVHGGHEPSFGRERMIELVDQYLASRDV